MAAERLKPKSVAVDTNVLIDLAAREPEVEASIAAVKKRLKGVSIIMPPTVVQELGWLAENGDDEETRNFATIAAQESRARWSIMPANCNPEWHGVIGLAAQELRERKIVHPEEVHDSLIIAEASLGLCALLISSDRHMLEIDNSALNDVLVRRDLGAIVIASPWKIVKDYG
jgi:predicted nucleic acid-binding protein